MRIEIVEYNPAWPDEFRSIAGELRKALADLALRIDHIGSTSVPGLAAKDRIDVQVSVQTLDEAVEQALTKAGFARVEGKQDHIPPGRAPGTDEWVKWVFKPPEDHRPANIHVRLDGRANQRYALLFRDFLRAHPDAAQAYALAKQALARYHPDDMKAYLDVKDPVCDLIMVAAEIWANQHGWHPGPSDG